LRQYRITVELADVRPVLLRAKEIPSPAAVDDRFLSNYAHVLLRALPSQLSADMQETVGQIDSLARALARRRADVDLRRAAFEAFQDSTRNRPPTDAEQRSQYQSTLESLERSAREAAEAHIEAENNYLQARSRIDRVVTHVRKNITYYMQHI